MPTKYHKTIITCLAITFTNNHGDEYYLYTWISADDSLGTNNSTLSDTTENLVGIPAGWYKTIVIDAIGCSDTIEFGEFKDSKVRFLKSKVEQNERQIKLNKDKLRENFENQKTLEDGLTRHVHDGAPLKALDGFRVNEEKKEYAKKANQVSYKKQTTMADPNKLIPGTPAYAAHKKLYS